MDTTHSTLSLTWTAPASDGGSPVIGYLVECRRANTADWIRCNIPRNLQETSYVIQNLIDKNEYQCRISAVNKVGFSEPVEVPGKHVAKDIIGKNTSLVFGVKFCLGPRDIKPWLVCLPEMPFGNIDMVSKRELWCCGWGGPEG